MELPSEELIAQRLLERDEATLRAVMREHGGSVLALARRVVADPTLAEEVAQDTFVALWRRPGAFDPSRGRLRAFLLGVARNKAVDLVRKEESSRRTTASLMAEAEAKSESGPTNEQFLEAERRQDVKDALSRLSGVQREALVLAYFGGRSYREVADELDIPEGTAKTRLRDGLKRLRQVMATEKGS
jgi:RNA polymerase sigma-70 factor (ECF subfamily)